MQSSSTQSDFFYKSWAWVEAHIKQVLIGVVAIVVVALAVVFFLWQQGQKETNASEALSKVILRSSSANSTDEFLKVAKENAKTDAAGRALLLAAGNFFAANNFPEAKTQFENFLRDYPNSSFTGQALLGVAASLDAQGKTDEAVNAYKNLVDRHTGENSVPQAKFALARIYEAQGNYADAKRLFGELAGADANGSIGSEAGIRLEELLAKNQASSPVGLRVSPPSTNLPDLKLLKP